MVIIDILTHPITQIVIIVVIAMIAHRFSSRIISTLIHRIMLRHDFETVADREKQERTVAGIFRATAAVLIWLIAAGAIMSVLKFNLGQVAAGAGFFGIIIGLGAQATIRDYLAGIFILLEGQYRVGDIVSLNGGGVSEETSGVVEDISLRITKLRDLDGTIHIIRNGEASIITNRTFKYSSVVIDVGVAYDSDIDLVEKVMNRVGLDMLKDEELAKVIQEPIHFFRVDAFGESAVIIKTLGKVAPAKQWDIGGEYRRRLLYAFRQEGIDITVPRMIIQQTEKVHQKSK
ncbi:mechanosensitive ion channel family protein [Candidatus Saccharibacteria bacterium]|nr:mechanosensitive ion channel family protein [Candidatus Saccharibacteria bacterium]